MQRAVRRASTRTAGTLTVSGAAVACSGTGAGVGSPAPDAVCGERALLDPLRLFQVSSRSEQRCEGRLDVSRGCPGRRPEGDDASVPRRRLPQRVGEIGNEGDQRASLRGASGNQGLV